MEPRKATFVLASTERTIIVDEIGVPFTVTLKSSDVTRKIELSTDGVEFFSPIYDSVGNTATQKLVSVNAPIYAVKLTGVANDIGIINSGYDQGKQR